MKSLIILLLLSAHLSFSQNNNIEDKIIRFSYLWGYLKYTCPQITENKNILWDKLLVNYLDSISLITEKQAIQRLLKHTRQNNTKALKLKDSKIQFDTTKFHIIQNDFYNYYSDTLKHLLRYAFQYRSKNIYAPKNNINTFDILKYFLFKELPVITTLTKNIKQNNFRNHQYYKLYLFISTYEYLKYYHPFIKYYYFEFRKCFTSAIYRFTKNPTAFNLDTELKQLLSTLNDGHADVYHTNFQYGKFLPVSFILLNNKVIVGTVFNEQMASAQDLHLNTELLVYDSLPVKDYLFRQLKYTTGSSTDNKIDNIVLFQLYHSIKKDSVWVTIVNKKDTVSRFLHFIKWKEEYHQNPISLNDTINDFLEKTIPSSYYYFRIYKYSNTKSLKTALKRTITTDSIPVILDVRQRPDFYPDKALFRMFGKGKKCFAHFKQYSKQPFYYSYQAQYTTKGKNKFSNPVFIITSRYTISYGETLTLILKQIDNYHLIGEKTNGTNGDMVSIKINDDLFISYSSLEVLDNKGKTTIYGIQE